MTSNTKPSVPFVWPGSQAAGDIPSFRPLVLLANRLLGIVYGVNQAGVQWLKDTLRDAPALKCRLILALYPACPTRESDLANLAELERLLADRAQFRLLLTDGTGGLPANVLWLSQESHPGGIFCKGPSPNFGLAEAGIGQVNFVFHDHAVLREHWCKWFDTTWCDSGVPLREETMGVPALVPAPGSAEAAKLWGRYVEQCRAGSVAGGQSQVEQLSLIERQDAAAGSAPASNGGGVTAPRSPTEELGVPRADEVAEKMAHLFDAGALVTPDKGTRIPPLDAPLKAEWLGIESFKQVGAISRTTNYRISILDDKTFRELENKRKKLSKLLPRLSFPMADGVRWIPYKAQALLEKEMERVNNEGQALLAKTVGSNPAKFVALQRERVEKDANEAYQEFFPGRELHTQVVDRIMNELVERLAAARAGTFLPKVSYAQIQFSVNEGSQWVSEWGQALTLLHAVARYPRECITDVRFMWGLRIGKELLLEAMDVAGDAIVAAYNKGSDVVNRAWAELHSLETIMDDTGTARWKCEAIFGLLDGADPSKNGKKQPLES